ncbi:lysophospholipid acyltransferase family protein [Pseudophaeobacter sp. A-200-2]|uniref:lysophospholipid acyltransferase family protein n=1 Tax=Pseudophaeobacter sp. A-200-2 TaxID=3098145 RepID=UPI0034D3E2EE
MSLRKRIADSPRFNRTIEGLFAAYVRFAYRTSRWQRSGFEEMDACVKRGEPVIFVLWHQRLIMAPYLFDTSLGRICALTSAARAGRLAGQILVRLGFETIPMSSHKRHVALSREVLRRTKEGCSIGIAADGPRGPARISSGVPITWARMTGCRVFTVAFAEKKVLKLPTWDKQMLPLPFSRGVLICQEWQETVPKKPTDDEAEALRQSLEQALDQITDKADHAAGRAPDPIKSA